MAFPFMAAAMLASSAMQAGASIYGANETNQANIDMMLADQAFKERMTRHAHQYEVEDLRAAGLNPILSANNGAQVPNASMPVMINPMRDIPGILDSTARNLIEGYSKKQGIKTQGAVEKEQVAQAKLNEQNVQKSEAETRKASAEARIAERDAEFETSKMGRFLYGARNAVSVFSPISQLVNMFKGWGSNSAKTENYLRGSGYRR